MHAMLLIAEVLLISIGHIVASATCSTSLGTAAPYELIHETDTTTELTDSVTLKFRDAITLEELQISEIKFFLNRRLPTDPSLRERGDITVIEVGRVAINFNLTRKYEGNYTCGKKVDGANVRESMSRTFIYKCI